MTGGIIIMGLDDVLMDASVSQYETIRCNWARYSPYLIDMGNLTRKQIHDRPLYAFNDWLIRPEFRSMAANDYANVQVRLLKQLEDDFYSKNAHASMPIMPIAYGSVLNPKYMLSGTVKKVYVYASYLDENPSDKKNKLEAIESNFKGDKVEPLLFPATKTLMDAISEKGIEWDLLVTEDSSLIRKIAERYKSLAKKEFFVPRYGYNAVPQEVKILIEGKGGVINYYDAD
jgi:hypothetical protein